MKKFSQFIQEAKSSLVEFKKDGVNFSTFHALRIVLPTRGRMRPDGHGGFHDSNTGEFIAKSVEHPKIPNRYVLKFFNKPQRIGKKDPNQDRSKPFRLVPSSHQVAEEFEKQLREKYISGKIFNIGEWVQNINTDQIGKIIRRGTNYLICVTEDDVMFKPWIKDVVEWTNHSGVPAKQREVGTDSLRKYVMSMTGTTDIKNFINKYKAKSK